jgi:hypothetical protein
VQPAGSEFHQPVDARDGEHGVGAGHGDTDKREENALLP